MPLHLERPLRVLAMVSFHIVHRDLGEGTLRTGDTLFQIVIIVLEHVACVIPRALSSSQVFWQHLYHVHFFMFDRGNWYAWHRKAALCRIWNVSALVQKLSASLPIITFLQPSSLLFTDCRRRIRRSTSP